MGLKDKMMERMIDKMSKEEKQEMMDKMMDRFFASMTKAERKEMMATMMPKMMDNMFKGMSSAEKQELMMAMMPQMMGMMFGGAGGGGSTSPMAGMMEMMMGPAPAPKKSIKTKNGKKKVETPEAPAMPPMMKMMESCCGTGDDFKPPWISMENAFDRAMVATEHSLLATKEIQKLFKDWVKIKNQELLKYSHETPNLKELAEKLQISRSSLYFLLCKLAQDDKINLKIGH
ncbi:MAG: hypothetical protein KAJ51_11010 [Thermoplasmata archaeon]|nr:hypothetical protein [Thermoplasmata archaeon]